MLPSNNTNGEDVQSQSNVPRKTPAIVEYSSDQISNITGKATGRWTREEHFRFLEALKIHGKEWKRVQ